MYFGDHPVSPNWGIHLEGQWRRQGFGEKWEYLLLRPGVSYDLGRGMSVMLAYTYLRTYPFEEGSFGDPDVTGPQPEHRILQEFKYKHNLIGSGEKAVTLAHRFRTEQRFQGSSRAGIGTYDWDFTQRFRYRLEANIPFGADGALPDYASLYNEVFVNFGPHGYDGYFNQNRAYGAVGWDLGDWFQVEVGYLHQHLPVPNGAVGVNNHALQVSINSNAPFRRGLPKKD